MNDMRVPPGLLNALQGTGREGQDVRTQGQTDVEAARAFERLFQQALREPAREPVREPVRDPVREPARESVREQAQAERTPERGADRSSDRDGNRVERQEQRASQDAGRMDAARQDTDSSAASRSPGNTRAARSSDDTAADATAPDAKAADAKAAGQSDDAVRAGPQSTHGQQLTLDPALLASHEAGQAASALATDAAAARAALLQAAHGTAAASDAATEAAGGGKAGRVATQIDGIAGALTGSKDGKDAKHGAAPDAAALVTPATGEAQARTGLRDRLLEDFERRFERSLAAAASGGREGFTPGTPQALAALATAATPGTTSAQPLYSSAHASVGTPLMQPGFGDELSNRVLLFAGQRVQNAELAVTPADLGPIKVSIELRGQEATLAFTAQHATTRAAIEDALPKLREMFAGQGLQLAQAHVGDQRRQDSGRYSGQRGDGARAIDGAGNGRPSTIGAGGTGGLPNAYGVRGIGLIDIHV